MVVWMVLSQRRGKTAPLSDEGKNDKEPRLCGCERADSGSECDGGLVGLMTRQLVVSTMTLSPTAFTSALRPSSVSTFFFVASNWPRGAVGPVAALQSHRTASIGRVNLERSSRRCIAFF